MTNLKNILLENYSKYFDDLLALSGERSLPFGLLVISKFCLNHTKFEKNLSMAAELAGITRSFLASIHREASAFYTLIHHTVGVTLLMVDSNWILGLHFIFYTDHLVIPTVIFKRSSSLGDSTFHA